MGELIQTSDGLKYVDNSTGLSLDGSVNNPSSYTLQNVGYNPVSTGIGEETNFLSKFTNYLGDLWGNTKDAVSSAADSLLEERGTGSNSYNLLGQTGNVVNAYLNYRLGNKKIDVLQDQVNLQKDTARYNALNQAGTQLANAGTRLQALSDFGNGAASRVASTYTDLGNTMVSGISSLGADTSALQNQVNNLAKYSSLKAA